MTTTDHVTAARNALSKSSQDSLDDGHAQLTATQALTHATVALVEEQRTANLMALFIHIDKQGDMPDHARELFADIATRLGLRGEFQ